MSNTPITDAAIDARENGNVSITELYATARKLEADLAGANMRARSAVTMYGHLAAEKAALIAALERIATADRPYTELREIARATLARVGAK